MRDEPVVLRASRPPLLLGCLAIVAVAVALVVVLVSCVVFLESGADQGELTLRPLAAYPEGSVDYVGEENFFVVRTPGGAVLALSDLDAANRAADDRFCRVQLASLGTDENGRELRGRMTPEAAGVVLVLTEACNGAVYDITGVRLDADGPNLDRHPVRLSEESRVIVDVSERDCTRRTETEARVATACAE